MMKRAMWAALASLGIACGAGGADDEGLASGGDKVGDPGYGDTGGGSNGSPPEITGVGVVLDSNPDGDVLEFTVSYTDVDGDVYDGSAGGTLNLAVVEGDGESDSFSPEVGSATAPIDSDTGDIIFTLSNIDPELAYAVALSLTDMAGNKSDEVSADYTP